jgi:hypothetical protein
MHQLTEVRRFRRARVVTPRIRWNRSLRGPGATGLSRGQRDSAAQGDPCNNDSHSIQSITIHPLRHLVVKSSSSCSVSSPRGAGEDVLSKRASTWAQLQKRWKEPLVVTAGETLRMVARVACSLTGVLTTRPLPIEGGTRAHAVARTESPARAPHDCDLRRLLQAERHRGSTASIFLPEACPESGACLNTRHRAQRRGAAAW